MTGRRKRLIAALAAAVLAAAVGWLLWGNTALQTTVIRVTSSELPGGFDGFRIVQLSDFHDAEIGRNNERLIAAVAEAEPDIIVITGDLIDRTRTDIPHSLALAEAMMRLAPVYYVNGNHEASLDEEEYLTLRDSLRGLGITVLEDAAAEISAGPENIRLIGLRDIGFLEEPEIDDRISSMQTVLEDLTGDGSAFTVTLSHRPELIEVYSAAGTDLVLCGHAHGGQLRLPLLGGVFAPGQGLRPEYDAGLYENGDTSMVVSRGIGNSRFPLRINNRPEIVVVELKCE